MDLPEMLEGQVAALTRGILPAREQAELVDALFSSSLYRTDQRTFVLARPQMPPSFLDKNVIPTQHVDRNPLFRELLASGDRSIVVVDDAGAHRFASALVTEGALRSALDRLAHHERWSRLVEQHHDLALDSYEAVFRHRAYVGRSGSMHAYEGVGSIYWHMVSKLLLAVQEAASTAADVDAAPDDVARLVAAYRRVRGGLGFRKSGAEFGAIPIEPYSHTPAHAGAQQPGMTGAVKEEILARLRELGVRVVDGQIVFDALLVDRRELLEESASWTVPTVDGRRDTVELGRGSFGLTVCQVPVIVTETAEDPWVELDLADGRTLRVDGSAVPRSESAEVFARSGVVRRIRAGVRLDSTG
jgi:hypothetical protein